MKSSSTQRIPSDTAVTPKPILRDYWQEQGHRFLTVFVVLVALALAFVPEHDQQRLQMPDPWSYEAATAQFAVGKWVLNDEEMAAIRTQARFLNAPTPQYIHLGPDAWAFRQAAGHPLEMVAAQWLWHPRLANALLAVLAALALYPLLAAGHSERLAFVGVTLLFFSPLSSGAVFGWRLRPVAFRQSSLPTAPRRPTESCLLHPITAVPTHPFLHRQLPAGDTAVIFC